MATRLISVTYSRDNVSGTTDHLKGHLLSEVTATIQLGVTAYIKANDDKALIAGDPDYITPEYITDLDGFGFEDFRKGDTIEVALTYEVAGVDTAYPENGTYEVADVISEGTIRLQQVGGGPVSLSNRSCTGGSITVTSEPRALKYSFGIVENSQANTYKSLIDGQELSYEINSVSGLSGTLTDMETIGKLNGYSGNAQARKIGFADDEYTYEIVHTFYINPLYLINQKALIEDGKAPSYLQLDKSLKHIFKVNTYREDSSSTFFQTLEVDRDGNVGYINENFNGGQPDFSFGTMTYGNTIAQAAKSVATTFDLTINEDLAAGKYIELYFYMLPEDADDYEQINTPMPDLYAFDKVIVEVGGGSVNGYRFGGGFQAFTGVTAVSAASVITVSGTLDFGADTQALIEQRTDKNYLIYAAVVSDLQTANDSNEVLLIADYNRIGFELPVGMVTTETLFLSHDVNVLSDGIGYVTKDMLINEEMVMNNTINLDTSLINDTFLNKVKGSVIAKKSSGEVVVLESKEFDITGNQTIDGVRFADITTATGFNALDTEIRSSYRLYRDSVNDADPIYQYRFSYPFIFRWEYYKQLQLATLEPDFFDATQDFNGYNNDWQRLGTLTDWDIFFRLETTIEGNGKIASNISDTEIVHYDYLENIEWYDEKIECFDESDTELSYGGKPYLSDVGQTKIVASFYNDALDVVSAYYMVIQFARKDQDGIFQIETASSVWNRSTISKLKNDSNGGKIALEIVGGNELKGTCFINPDDLNGDVSEYTIYAWVKGFSLPVPGCTIEAISSGNPNTYSLMAIQMSGSGDTGAGNGTATATTIRGASPYTYLWDDPLEQTTQTATGLSEGIYTCVVTDANGCTISGSYEVLNEAADYSGMLAAYSFRKLDPAFTGDLVLVRRSSDDSTMGFGFIGGVFDEAGMLSFIGGGDGFIERFYTQGLAGGYLRQETLARQPKIVDTGVSLLVNGKLSINHSGGQWLIGGDSGSLAGDTGIDMSYFTRASDYNAHVVSTNTIANDRGEVASITNIEERWSSFNDRRAVRACMLSGTAVFTELLVQVDSADARLISGKHNGSAVSPNHDGYYNGLFQDNAALDADIEPTEIVLGARNDTGTAPLTGNIGDVIYMPQTSDFDAINDDIIDYFTIV